MAYVGTVKIDEAAAGFGFGQPPAHAYREGSLGGGGVSKKSQGGAASHPAQHWKFRIPFIRAFGQPPAHAYREGSLGQPPVHAFREGSLGGALEDAKRKAALHKRHRNSRLQTSRVAQMHGFGQPPAHAYREGSLGRSIDSNTGMWLSGLGQPPAHAYREGSLGVDEPLPGIATNLAILDLTDPQALKELKTAIGMHPLLMAMVASAQGQESWPQDFYTDGIWDERAAKLWQLATEAFAAQMKKQPGEVWSSFTAVPAIGKCGMQNPPPDCVGDKPFPNAVGVMYTLATSVGAPSAATQEYFRTNMPVLSGWYELAVKNPAGAQVSPPFFSDASKTKHDMGAPEFKMSTVALWSLGGAALVASALVFGSKKKTHTPNRRKR